MIYVIKTPSGDWLSRDGQVMPFADMAAAQMEILVREPDPIEAGKWQIHPIEPGNADTARLRLKVTYTLEKYDLDGNLIERITGEG
jgi:hypothetical protein